MSSMREMQENINKWQSRWASRKTILSYSMLFCSFWTRRFRSWRHWELSIQKVVLLCVPVYACILIVVSRYAINNEPCFIFCDKLLHGYFQNICSISFHDRFAFGNKMLPLFGFPLANYLLLSCVTNCSRFDLYVHFYCDVRMNKHILRHSSLFDFGDKIFATILCLTFSLYFSTNKSSFWLKL